MSDPDPQVMAVQTLQPEDITTASASGNSTLSAMDKSPYFIFSQIGPHWRGRGSLKNLIVFGDSYSSRLSRLWSSKPNEEDPYDTDGRDATWINFFASSTSSWDTTVVVKNFAFPGHTLRRDLDGQMARFFEDPPKDMKSGEFTFVFFLGINDCGGIPPKDLSSLTKTLFVAVRRLYVDVTARNFIIVDVPPTNRSPAALAVKVGTAVTGRIKEWNESLVTHASEFVSNSTDTTMLLFSSNKVLSEILDDPGAHGFQDENAREVAGRGIWLDKLHLTPATHKIIASRLSSALGLD